MSENAQLGQYGFSADHRGIRVERAGDAPGTGGLRAVLQFTLTESGDSPQLFQIGRVTQEGPDRVAIHAYVTDRIALDATLTSRPDLEGLQLNVHLINSTESMTVRIGVHLDLVGQADPKWLIPGLFYGENRVRDCQRVYPAWSEIQRDPARFLTNHWNFRSDRSATPVVFCMTYVMMAFLSTEESFGLSDSRPRGQGITSLGISAEEGHPRLEVHGPYLEDPVKYSYCHEHKTLAEQTFVRLNKNEPLTMSLQFGLMPLEEGARQPWKGVLRAIGEEKRVMHPQSPRMPAHEAERLAVKGLTRWHLDEEAAMIHETASFDKHYGRKGQNYERTHMHSGWLSGMLPAYALLWHGRDTMTPEYVNAAQNVINRITGDLAPCGTLWPVQGLEEGPMAGLGPEEGLAHARTIAEALLFLIRAFRLEVQASTMHPQWFAAVQSNLNWLVENQREDGALPTYWFVDDGDVLSYGGCAGVCWIAPLAAFDHFVSSSVYRDAAVKAAEYYAQFVEDSFLYGCVEDLPLVPTADDGHWAAMSYTILYETDRNARWLALAREAAELAFTWRMTYNIRFHPNTMPARGGIQTRGGDISSVATPYLCPAGLVSIPEMKKLSALTGDPFYEQRARESRIYASQLLARVDGEFNARSGMALGQVFHTDWWQPKGMVLSLSFAFTTGLVIYAEMVERTLVIPTSALTADDAESVAEAAHSSAGAGLLDNDIVLPDPAAVRRSRSTSIIELPSLEEEAGSTELPPEEEENLPPTRIIGSAPRASNLTPLPWETQSDTLTNLFSASAAAFGQEQKPGPKPKVAGDDDKTRRRFARRSGTDMERPRSVAEDWGILPPEEEKPRRRTHHTPLSDDEVSADIWKRPLVEPDAKSGEGGKSDADLPEPPPELAGGLLRGLFEDDEPAEEDDRVHKLSDEEKAAEDRPLTPEPDEEESGEDQGSEIKWKIF